MSDRPVRNEEIGDALARALDPIADWVKRNIWRRFASVLDGVFEPKPIDIIVDPTVNEVYMPNGKWCWAKVRAWQLDPITSLPIALWVKKTDASKDWEKIWPAEGGDDHKVAVNEDDAASETWDYLEYKLSSPNGTVSFAPVAGTLPTLGLDVVCSTEDPLPDGPEADPGTGPKPAAWNHIHPQVRPTKIRYYLSDTLGTGDWEGNLVLTENPYDEEHAIDLTGSVNQMLEFVSAPGSPGVIVWPGGSVHAHLRLRLTGARMGRTYKLYNGDRSIVYASLVGDWTSGDVYQTTPHPTEPTVTEAYADLDFDIPVASMLAAISHRFWVKLVLRAYVGDVEDGLDGEQLIARVGGDNASYFDTLFTPDGSFSGLHNDLDERNADNAHPFNAITPGRVINPANPVVTTVDGHFAVPVNSNFVVLDGAEDLLGCSTVGWSGNSEFEALVMQGRNLLKSQSPLLENHSPFIWGATDTGYGADYDVIALYPYSVCRFRLVGGNWRLCSMMNV